MASSQATSFDGWCPGRSLKQLSDAALAATSPFQYALSTRAGCECISHALQSLSELDPNATVLSNDGIGAFDLVSRGAMLQGLANVCPSALFFARQFYGSPSHYIWEDDAGVVHDIAYREGGEQGDHMMPLLCSLGQHAALMAVQCQLAAHERVFAFLDDVYIVTSPGQNSRRVHHFTGRIAATFTHPRARWQDASLECIRFASRRVRHFRPCRSGSQSRIRHSLARRWTHEHARHQSVGCAFRPRRFRERSFVPHNGGPHVIIGENPFVARRAVSMGFVAALR